MKTIKKSIFRTAAAFALCASFAATAAAAAVEWADVKVKVPGKEDVPLDTESAENVKQNSRTKYGGIMTDGAALSTESGREFNTYKSSFEVIWYDQWRASLKRYASVKETNGELTLRREYELASALKPPTAERRVIKFWDFDKKAFVDLDANKDLFATLTGMNGIKVKSGDELADWDLSGSPEPNYQGIEPVDAYIDWLHGYDFSYANALVGSEDRYVRIQRDHVLTDVGQGAIVINGPPDVYDSLPGYRDWSNDDKRKGRKPAMYAQTNDGIFHVIDPTSMKETAALILPSSLLPGRLASVKTDKGAWIDISGDVKAGTHRSDPVYLLDGPMQLRHFNLKNSGDARDWRTYLIGTLGRAGNGLYMMDVDDPASPKLMWYRETIHDYSASDPGDSDRDSVTMIYSRDGSAPTIVERDLKWEGHDPVVDVDITTAPDPAKRSLWPAWMGFNIPKPAPGVVGTVSADSFGTSTIDLRNIIAISGGIKSRLNTNELGVDSRQGAEGGAIYILDAETGDILKMFNSRSKSFNDPLFGSDQFGINGENIGNVGSIQAPMDSITADPTFIRTKDSRYIASGAIFCSQAGKIFMVRFGGEGTESSPDPKDWRILTIADSNAMHAYARIQDNAAIPHGVAITRTDDTDDIWIAAVTSDTVTRSDMGGTGDPLLVNTEQKIFSFRQSIDPGADDDINSFYNWKQLSKDDDDILNDGDKTWSEDYGGYDEDGDLPFAEFATGWYMILDDRDGVGGNYAAEYGTTRPLIVTHKGRQIMFVATFKPGLGGTQSVSNLYALDVETGEPRLWSGTGDGKTKGKGFAGIKITGLSLSEQGGRTTVLVTYDRTDRTNDVNDRMRDEDFLHKVGDDEIDAFVIDLGSNNAMHFNSGASIVDYWISK